MLEHTPQVNTSLNTLSSPDRPKLEIEIEIELALKPLMDRIKTRVFDDLGSIVRQECEKSQLGFKEAWVGIRDVGIKNGVSVVVLLCHPEIRHNEARQDYSSDLDLALTEKFPDISYIDVRLGHYPNEQNPESTKLERHEREDRWKRVFVDV